MDFGSAGRILRTALLIGAGVVLSIGVLIGKYLFGV